MSRKRGAPQAAQSAASPCCSADDASTSENRRFAPKIIVSKRLRRKKKNHKHTERQSGGLSYERSAPGAAEVVEFPAAAPRPESPSADDSRPAPMPSRLVTERLLGKLHQHLEGKNFASQEELSAYLGKSLKDPNLFDLLEGDSAGPIERAQDLAFEAMGTAGIEGQRLARQAVALDPDCVDARVVLALAEEREVKRISLLQQAVKAGERRLGKEFFGENNGRFWGLLETRPYMRARYELALELMSATRIQEGIGHLEVLLDLSLNDNIGAREDLLTAYLMADNIEAANDLAERYSEDGSAFFEWARVLISYLSREFAEASRALARARRANKYVERYLLRKKKLPDEEPFEYVIGRDSEAQHCAFHLEFVWSFHPAACVWVEHGGQPGDGKYFGCYSMMMKMMKKPRP